MATYAIGDLQGCYEELRHLLDACRFDPATDRLWLVGDLVNRGPGSLEVLRILRQLGDSVVAVLGNHDLHLLAVVAGVGKLHRNDTLQPILDAPDKSELLDWLRHRPLMHRENGYVLVHAGLLPQWTAEQARALAGEVEAVLQGGDHRAFFAHMYGNQPDCWKNNLRGYERLRVIVNACTRLRICSARGEMEFKFKGEAANIPAGYMPWFEVPERASADHTIVCGHWSALGLHLTPNVITLDTGCLWGGPLTAIRLEDRQLFQVPSVNPMAKDWE